MADEPHLFGIRHHGPGCARSLVKALDTLRPDCVLVEGPPEAEPLLPAMVSESMKPPVAWLSYCPDDTALAVYHPFALFSPEWQALGWAVRHGVPVRLIDLPLTHSLALEQQRRAALQAAPQASPIESAEATVAEEDSADDAVEPDVGDPLDWLARAAGYADGEGWWNHMVEERGDGEELFAAISEAMVTLRRELGDKARERSEHEARRETLREAQMRQCVREAQKNGHQRIAVVCGAWHLGGLQADVSAKADQQLLKGLAKVKVNSTWIPWTYRHLTRASGYGAGIASPGWYEHLWQSASAEGPRTVSWLARVARLMREKDLDCSSAHLIETARLADSLAALRERPQPGLDELNEATRTVLCMGDDAVLRLINDALVVGDRFGAVPPDVPVVPLQRDVEQQQKTLRLKAEALAKTLDLDLRTPNDLARSHLLHRLRLLDVAWGEVAKTGRSARGTFHEIWHLRWQPEFQLQLIEASRYGQTVLQASAARVIERAAQALDIEDLAELVDLVLLAAIPEAVQPVTQALENRAAVTGDALQLLAALPALANVFRYGSVRQTDASLVAHVLDGIIVRACISLPLTCASLDDAAAEALRDKLLAAHGAVALRNGEEQSEIWRRALLVVARQVTVHALIAGLATRLALDDGALGSDDAAQALGLQLSPGADPARAAAWLEGFLNRNAQVLLHDEAVWGLVDRWLGTLGEEHFMRVLPLVRRTFATFGPGERRDLGARARRAAGGQVVTSAAPPWDDARAALAIPVLRQIFGLPS